MTEMFIRGVFKFVRYVRNNPDEIESHLLWFIYAMIVCNILIGGMWALGVQP